MKKVILLILVSILLLLAFTSCAKIKAFFAKDDTDADNNSNQTDNVECQHVWAEATCQAPKTCTICAVTEGVQANHKTVAATCTTPQMCSVCGYTSEYWKPALGHDWKEATCLVTDSDEKAKPWLEQRGTPKTCRTCGLVDGKAIGHTLVEATCTTPAHCEVCSAINPEINNGKELGHNRVEIPYLDPTCTSKGSKGGEWCSKCHEIYENATVLPKLEHTVVQYDGKDANCTEDGMKPGEKCQECGFVFAEPETIPATGHQRCNYDVDGNVIEERPLTNEKYDGNMCEVSGVAYYNCVKCSTDVEVVIAPKDHNYNGATCYNTDAVCVYCHKQIEHEYSAPTCTAPATCKNCELVDPERPALEHNGLMLPATCSRPATCSACGYTEGDIASHKVSFGLYRGTVQYSCKICKTTYLPTTEVYHLDGSNYDNMSPVNNYFTGYITSVGSDGAPTHLPVIATDENGNKYYELIRSDRVPDNGSNGKPLSPQIQLWVPAVRAGFEGFNSANAAVGFFSFKMNLFMDRGMAISFTEGGGWGETDAISNVFMVSTVYDVLTDPKNPQSDKKQEIVMTGLNSLELKKIDVTGKVKPNPSANAGEVKAKPYVLDDSHSAEELYSGWFEVCIGIVFNTDDTFTLHYYIDGEYAGFVTKPLLTSGNGIKSVYISGNSDVEGSGMMLDDIAFGYLAAGAWPFDTDHVHNFNEVYERVDATCVNDGYIIYICEKCDLIGNKQVTPALGHTEVYVGAKKASCTEDGHNAYSECSTCKIEIVKKVIIPGGHNFTVQEDPATCTGGGAYIKKCSVCRIVEEGSIPPLGHEYPLSASCDSTAACVRCGVQSNKKIDHVMAPATCFVPSTCMREGCGHTEGDKLDHVMSNATCVAPSTCTLCNEYTEGQRKSHALSYKYKDSNIVYFCPGCDASFTVTNKYYLNGSNYDGMTGTDKNKDFTVKEGTTLPNVVKGTDRYYSLLSNFNENKQFELWIPKEDTSEGFGYASATNSAGFLSFRIKARIVKSTKESDPNSFTISIVDGASNQDDNNRWKHGGVAAKLEITPIDSNGQMQFRVLVPNLSDTKDRKSYSTAYTYDFIMDKDGFTEWTDIAIGMSLDSVADEITFHVYINGQYRKSLSHTLTTTSNAINCVYFSGYTAEKNSGIMLDEIVFGYAANDSWAFDVCNHSQCTDTVYRPTCTEDGYTKSQCNICGHISIFDKTENFGGHVFSEATCTEAAKCTNSYTDNSGKTVICGTEFGDALGHDLDFTNATCANAKAPYAEKPTPAFCNRVIGYNEDGTEIYCGLNSGVYSECTCDENSKATCSEKATCKWCGEKYGDYAHKWSADELCAKDVVCTLCGEDRTDLVPNHYPVPKYVDGKLSYACKYCKYTLTLENSYFHDGTTLNGFSTVDELNVFNSTSDQNAAIVTDQNGNRYYEFVLNDGTVEKKAAVWTPNTNGGIKDFEGFTMKDNMIGVFSIDLNVYLLSNLDMRFVDTDLRGSSWSWTDGALTGNFFTATPINKSNQVTLKGYGGNLKTITVTSEDKYTGWFNLTVGIVMDSSTNTVTLYYYIDGEYLGEGSQTMNISTGKIDGVYITNAGNASSGIAGSGYKFDNLGFGYAKPNENGKHPGAPYVVPDAGTTTDPENTED